MVKVTFRILKIWISRTFLFTSEEVRKFQILHFLCFVKWGFCRYFHTQCVLFLWYQRKNGSKKLSLWLCYSPLSNNCLQLSKNREEPTADTTREIVSGSYANLAHKQNSLDQDHQTSILSTLAYMVLRSKNQWKHFFYLLIRRLLCTASLFNGLQSLFCDGEKGHQVTDDGCNKG